MSFSSSPRELEIARGYVEDVLTGDWRVRPLETLLPLSSFPADIRDMIPACLWFGAEAPVDLRTNSSGGLYRVRLVVMAVAAVLAPARRSTTTRWQSTSRTVCSFVLEQAFYGPSLANAPYTVEEQLTRGRVILAATALSPMTFEAIVDLVNALDAHAARAAEGGVP